MNRLLLADLKRMWPQGLAITLLLGCGIALYVMSRSSMVSLENSCQRFYRDYRFADVFATLVRAPETLAARISELPGVARVDTRIVRDVLLDIPDMIEPASCRLVSIDVRDRYPMNAIHLTLGRFPEDQDRSEVIVNQVFAQAHGFRPGDHLLCNLGGRRQRLRIVGIGISPEYIYVVQPGLMVTDNRRYGVVWMPERQMEAAFNMEGAFNHVSIQLQPRANPQSVIDDLDRLTKRFGGTGAILRDDQESHHRVYDELSQMRTMSTVMPAIFLAVSAFLFNIVFTRLVHQQTEQIAALRAFGYRRSEIGWHYVKMVLALVAIGSVIGLAAGMRFSVWMLGEFGRFFRFPELRFESAASDAALAVLAAALIAIAGAFAAIRHAVTLQPAVAMRPSAPRDYRGLWAERIGLSRLLTPVGRMVVRRMETNRLATALSVIGMSFGIAILVLGSFFEDTIGYVVSFNFDKSQRNDVRLSFVETLSPSALHEIRHLPGVQAVEPFRSVPTRFRYQQRDYRVGLTGVEAAPQLNRVLDSNERSLVFPEGSGLAISEKLAEILEVKPGDTVDVQILERRQTTYRLPVGRVFPNFTQPSAYLNRRDLHRLLLEGEQFSGAYLSVDSGRMEELYTEVKNIPSIAGVLDKHAARRSFDETISESTDLMRVVYATFSILIAFGVIYNCAVIILAERSRDLATLRVMGFRRREVSMVLLGELAAVTLMAVPIGLPVGYALSYMTTVALDTETHRFPLVIHNATYAYATVVILAAASVSAIYVRRMLSKLDLVSVLKVKE